jgi:hypothetical protein
VENPDYLENYEPYFELGFYEKKDPAVLVLDNFEICPVALASLVTALFETVMRTVPDDKQIEFENAFNKSLDILMRERFDYDVTTKYPRDEKD